MTQNQLVHEILGKRYILVDVPMVSGIEHKVKRVVATYGLLFQGIKRLDRGGIFDRTVVIQTYFCPEENYISFSKDEYINS
jgi:hypothetical protein